MKLAVLLAAALALLFPATAQDDAPAPEPIKIMVLGTYHMSNPGLDVVNAEADDVTTDVRQAELEALAGRLAEFAPDMIAIERVSGADDLSVPTFETFTPDLLTTDRNEIVQIGYRLAHKLGHETVYGVDVQEGEIPFFPFEDVRAFEDEHGPAGKLQSLIDGITAELNEFEAMQADHTVPELLAWQNDPDRTNEVHNQFYYGLLDYAGPEDQPGARLNYGWYARNALIFANITRITEPGDRVLVIYGAGHNYWLRHFAETTPGYVFVDPLPYLR